MTTVSQTYTPALNVSITVEADGTLRGVTKWVSGASHTETERFGTADYTASRVRKVTPVLSEYETMVAYARTLPLVSANGSGVPAVVSVRNRFGSGLVDSVDAVNVARHEAGLPLLSTRPLRLR